MAGQLQPLDQKFAIVDERGNPTLYFIKWAQQRQLDIADGITLQNLIDYLTAHFIQEGSGIQITPDGQLPHNPVIAADVQEILDQITATRGAILYRGLLGWSALLPGTSGFFLKTNGAGADPAWAAAGGGGGPVLTPPVSTDFSITLNAPTVTDTSGGIVLAGAVNADILRGLLKPLPGGNFTVTIKVQGAWANDFNGAGLLFRDTAGKYITPCFINVSGGWVEISQWSDQTTFNSGTAFHDLDGANWPEWLKADFDATTNDVTAYCSFDGLSWLLLGTSTYLGTCDAFGIGIGNRNTTKPIEIAAFASWLVV